MSITCLILLTILAAWGLGGGALMADSSDGNGARAGVERICYVAPDGDDRSAGSLENPVATLARAVRRCHELAGEGDLGGCRIVVRDGTYFDVSLSLSERDSGLVIEAAEGEKPVLYGGVPLTGWQKDGDGFYAAPLPAAAKHGSQPRMLEVDGQMAPRARYPEHGELAHLSRFPVLWRGTTKGGWEREPTQAELTSMAYRPEDLGAWLELKDAELTVYHRWDESWAAVARIDPEAHTLRFATPLSAPPGALEVHRYVVWNVRQGMCRPGQWYHDRVRDCLVYWPLPGQKMDSLRAVVPTRQTIIRLAGAGGTPLRQVTLRGLTLCCTTVPLKSGGWAASDLDGAVSLENAEGCLLQGLEISRVCGQAIRTAGHVKALRVEDCEIGPCGAGGIYASGMSLDACSGEHVIRGNHVHHIGQTYAAAIGIMAEGRNNVVSHNEVHDCSYTAISCGGQENRIDGNLIYRCMQTLQDGAAIYLTRSSGCVICGNFARDIADHFAASAYYLDEECHNCVVEGNLSLRVKSASLNHIASGNTLRNNVFVAPAGDLEICFSRSADYALTKNIFWAEGAIRFAGIAGVSAWEGNLLYSRSGRIIGTTLDVYRVVGEVPGVVGDSVVGEPLFMDLESGDCRFRPGSAAMSLAIAPLDFRAAGRHKTSASPRRQTEARPLGSEQIGVRTGHD